MKDDLFFKLILEYFSTQYPNIYMEAVDYADGTLEDKEQLFNEQRKIKEAREFLSIFKLEHLL